MRNRPVALFFVPSIILILQLIVCPVSDAKHISPHELVQQADVVFLSFVQDSSMEQIRSSLKRARGIIIIPTSVKGGFIFGAEGGSGVMLARNEDSGAWSAPAFYAMRSVSFGLQAGGMVAEIILLVMTEKGMKALLSSVTRLGTDVSISGPYTASTSLDGSDIHVFIRSKGAFGGVSVKGAAITPQDNMNEIYYGRSFTPVEILVEGRAQSRQAARLRADIAKYAR